MNDCNGKRIALKSRLRCVNDVDPGSEFEVTSFASTLGISVDGAFFALKDFNMEDGCLLDFERLSKNYQNKQED